MSTFKRTISLLLVLGILLGVLAPGAQAAPAEEAASVNTDDVTIRGTNGFGNLLSQEIAESQAETTEAAEAYSGGYTVTDLEIADGVATVTYDSMEEATLVVALYTEDGMQLVTSAKTAVSPDETVATVTFEGELPEYFLASAYLLDSYDLSPLCAAYDTPMYTREMQELLASTVDDYDPEKVLNLDEDETTNFAVFADGVVIVEAVEGVNTVLRMDEENLIYVIGNASEEITSLEENSIFVYPISGEDILIVKVSDITVDEGTATIQGAELSLDEVFSHIKMESVADPENAEVEEDSGTQGIQYLGHGRLEEPLSVNGGDGSGSASDAMKFSIFYESEKDADGLSVRIKGDLALSVDADLTFHKAGWRSYVKLEINTVVDFGISVTGRKTDTQEISLKKLKLPFKIPCMKMTCEPKLMLRVDAGIELNGRFTATAVATVSPEDHDFRFSNVDLEWKNDEFDGEIFIAFNLNPNVSVEETVLGAKLHIVKLTIYMPLGVRLKFLDSTLDFSGTPEKVHTCNVCFRIPVDFVFKFSFRIMFLNNPKLGLDIPLGKEKVKPLFHLYWSMDHGEFDKGDCPHYLYRLTVAVKGEDREPLENAAVTIGSEQVTTNSNGLATLYLPKGTYTVTAAAGELTQSKKVSVDDAQKVTIKLAEIPEKDGGILDVIGSDGSLGAGSAVDNGAVVASGECGDDVSWTLYNSGHFVINGTGDMYNHILSIENPWYEYRIKIITASIDRGVTSIGGRTFSGCQNLMSLVIPDTVDYIGFMAFYICGSLSNMVFEGDAPFIYSNAFANATITAYYPAGNPTWTADVMQDYGGDITWVPYTPGRSNALVGEMTELAAPGTAVEIEAVYGGEYDTAITEEYTLKTASFQDLVPNEQYVLLAMASIEVEDPLAADNLLFIDQAAAAEEGTLVFQYVQRTPCEISYVVACGPSHKDLKDAEITFPEMVADGELQVVDPVVVYDGETLVEGRDYVIVGKVDFTEGGTYTCFIRGIHNYTGLVECSYTIGQRENPFTDVAEGAFYFEPVLWAVENGITTGMDATHFGPNTNCVRGQVVTFLWRAVGCPEPTRTDNPFEDVKPSDFYYKPVLWALENSITTGLDATHFGPAAACNRAQVVTFLYRAVGSPALEREDDPFADVNPTDFYYRPVLWALENGITTGLSDTAFGASAICNRAQIVTFLYRAFVDA